MAEQADESGVAAGKAKGDASPLTGCYLLIVIGEPASTEHKELILQRISKGFLSWPLPSDGCDLNAELQLVVNQQPKGDEAKSGEHLIQYVTEHLVTEVLINAQVNTLQQCVKNLLSSYTRHKHIIHAGYAFSGSGSWVLQDGTFSYLDLLDALQEAEVQWLFQSYENSISVHVHCAPEGEWSSGALAKESTTKFAKVLVNPDDKCSLQPGMTNFVAYVAQFLKPQPLGEILEPSDVVGNIRFSRPTLYVFPGGQGDSALFGVNGFNMLVDGGFSRRACFWDFVRHLDRVDALLVTRLNNSNMSGVSSLLRRKAMSEVYPHIGHIFCNVSDKKQPSPDGLKDQDGLVINIVEENQAIVENLKQLNVKPQQCFRDPSVEPVNLYHKVGHGRLDMYVVNPSRDSREVKEFLHQWNAQSHHKSRGKASDRELTIPLPNLMSICALLVWQPADPCDSITRILFPGSSPQSKIFEGLDKLKHLNVLKHSMCTEKSLASIIPTKKAPATPPKYIPPKPTKVKEKYTPPRIERKTETKMIEKKEEKKPAIEKKEEKKVDAKPAPAAKPAKKEEQRKTTPKAEEKKEPQKIEAHRRPLSSVPSKRTETSKVNAPNERSPKQELNVKAKVMKDASNKKAIEAKNIATKAATAMTAKREVAPKKKPLPSSPAKKTAPKKVAPIKKEQKVQDKTVIFEPPLEQKIANDKIEAEVEAAVVTADASEDLELQEEKTSLDEKQSLEEEIRAEKDELLLLEPKSEDRTPPTELVESIEENKDLPEQVIAIEEFLSEEQVQKDLDQEVIRKVGLTDLVAEPLELFIEQKRRASHHEEEEEEEQEEEQEIQADNELKIKPQLTRKVSLTELVAEPLEHLLESKRRGSSHEDEEHVQKDDLDVKPEVYRKVSLTDLVAEPLEHLRESEQRRSSHDEERVKMDDLDVTPEVHRKVSLTDLVAEPLEHLIEQKRKESQEEAEQVQKESEKEIKPQLVTRKMSLTELVTEPLECFVEPKRRESMQEVKSDIHRKISLTELVTEPLESFIEHKRKKSFKEEEQLKECVEEVQAVASKEEEKEEEEAEEKEEEDDKAPAPVKISSAVEAFGADIREALMKTREMMLGGGGFPPSPTHEDKKIEKDEVEKMPTPPVEQLKEPIEDVIMSEVSKPLASVKGVEPEPEKEEEISKSPELEPPQTDARIAKSPSPDVEEVEVTEVAKVATKLPEVLTKPIICDEKQLEDLTKESGKEIEAIIDDDDIIDRTKHKAEVEEEVVVMEESTDIKELKEKDKEPEIIKLTDEKVEEKHKVSEKQHLIDDIVTTERVQSPDVIELKEIKKELEKPIDEITSVSTEELQHQIIQDVTDEIDVKQTGIIDFKEIKEHEESIIKQEVKLQEKSQEILEVEPAKPVVEEKEEKQEKEPDVTISKKVENAVIESSKPDEVEPATIPQTKTEPEPDVKAVQETISIDSKDTTGKLDKPLLEMTVETTSSPSPLDPHVVPPQQKFIAHHDYPKTPDEVADLPTDDEEAPALFRTSEGSCSSEEGEGEQDGYDIDVPAPQDFQQYEQQYLRDTMVPLRSTEVIEEEKEEEEEEEELEAGEPAVFTTLSAHHAEMVTLSEGTSPSTPLSPKSPVEKIEKVYGVEDISPPTADKITREEGLTEEQKLIDHGSPIKDTKTLSEETKETVEIQITAPELQTPRLSIQEETTSSVKQETKPEEWSAMLDSLSKKEEETVTEITHHADDLQDEEEKETDQKLDATSPHTKSEDEDEYDERERMRIKMSAPVDPMTQSMYGEEEMFAADTQTAITPSAEQLSPRTSTSPSKDQDVVSLPTSVTLPLNMSRASEIGEVEQQQYDLNASRRSFSDDYTDQVDHAKVQKDEAKENVYKTVDGTTQRLDMLGKGDEVSKSPQLDKKSIGSSEADKHDDVISTSEDETESKSDLDGQEIAAVCTYFIADKVMETISDDKDDEIRPEAESTSKSVTPQRSSPDVSEKLQNDKSDKIPDRKQSVEHLVKDDAKTEALVDESDKNALVFAQLSSSTAATCYSLSSSRADPLDDVCQTDRSHSQEHQVDLEICKESSRSPDCQLTAETKTSSIHTQDTSETSNGLTNGVHVSENFSKTEKSQEISTHTIVREDLQSANIIPPSSSDANKEEEIEVEEEEEEEEGEEEMATIPPPVFSTDTLSQKSSSPYESEAEEPQPKGEEPHVEEMPQLSSSTESVSIGKTKEMMTVNKKEDTPKDSEDDSSTPKLSHPPQVPVGRNSDSDGTENNNHENYKKSMELSSMPKGSEVYPTPTAGKMLIESQRSSGAYEEREKEVEGRSSDDESSSIKSGNSTKEQVEGGEYRVACSAQKQRLRTEESDDEFRSPPQRFENGSRNGAKPPVVPHGGGQAAQWEEETEAHPEWTEEADDDEEDPQRTDEGIDNKDWPTEEVRQYEGRGSDSSGESSPHGFEMDSPEMRKTPFDFRRPTLEERYLPDLKRHDATPSSASSTQLSTPSSESGIVKDEKNKTPIDDWGEPMGLPSPPPPPGQDSKPNGVPNGKVDDHQSNRPLPSNKKSTTASPRRTLPAKTNKDINKDLRPRRSESPKPTTDMRKQALGKLGSMKSLEPSHFYVDLAYVPHHGNPHYSNVDFFKRVRARYYVLSGINPSKEVLNSLLEAKQSWEDKELEVTIIPTYDTDTLGYWVALNEETLTKNKIDLAPSASRCTINLQDHETSCSAYRLEF